MKSLANAVGGKTARACDSCVKRRARWYCAADDAFLCQACDSSVHSANPLARRHERVRLKSASLGGNHRPMSSPSVSPPRAAAWHQGFTRKARTPRGGSGKKSHRAIFHDLVPEISVEDQTESYEEEHLICQVPVLDPLVAEQYGNDALEAKTGFPLPVRMKCGDINDEDDEDNGAESCLNGFFPTDMELAEFAADVETLLGRGLETESFAMEELGLGDGLSGCGRSSSMILKVEKEDVDEGEVIRREGIDTELLCDRDEGDVAPFELSFDYDESHETREEDDDKENVINVNIGDGENERSGGNCRSKEEKKKVLMLRLNYESVISTWGGQGPPWTAGEPPELDLDNDCWAISMGDRGTEVHCTRFAGGISGGGLQAALGDGGREARVSRYREKRRTRLFSKKIRYEVRKLNAEKRPRMKGRFVKRTSIAAVTSSFPVLTK